VNGKTKLYNTIALENTALAHLRLQAHGFLDQRHTLIDSGSPPEIIRVGFCLGKIPQASVTQYPCVCVCVCVCVCMCVCVCVCVCVYERLGPSYFQKKTTAIASKEENCQFQDTCIDLAEFFNNIK
jgi:hypothetical protein